MCLFQPLAEMAGATLKERPGSGCLGLPLGRGWGKGLQVASASMEMTRGQPVSAPLAAGFMTPGGHPPLHLGNIYEMDRWPPALEFL